MAKAILDALGIPDHELSVLILDDQQITTLNRKYLNRNKPTNVIAFPMMEENPSDTMPNLLGDVVISSETAEKEGIAAGIPFEERLVQLLIHGILHLKGYDHVKSDKEARKMEYKSNDLFKIIKENYI